VILDALSKNGMKWSQRTPPGFILCSIETLKISVMVFRLKRTTAAPPEISRGCCMARKGLHPEDLGSAGPLPLSVLTREAQQRMRSTGQTIKFSGAAGRLVPGYGR
jgi:hypothetical protein